jgi:hypothetical protein
VDVASASRDVVVTFTVSDPDSGIDRVDLVSFDHESHVIGGVSTRISGDEHTATYQATVTFPENTWRGAWNLSRIYVVDKQGNNSWGDASTLSGAPTVVTNTNPGF